MDEKASFSVLEKEFMHVMRSGISNSEDKIDLENHFSNIMKCFMKRVFENEQVPAEIDDNDVIFSPGARNYYTISGKLKQMREFKNLWVGTDLPSVISRFAESTHKKYLHLDKHREKTRFKIRH